jgi:hypothetical protein
LTGLAAILVALGLGGSLPERGVLVAGESLGGLRLKMTQAEVREAWGTSYGRCRNCADPTWPAGWRTSRGLAIGDAEARATTLHGSLLVVHCQGYDALVASRRHTQTAIYVRDGTVWGFGLSSAAVPVCR